MAAWWHSTSWPPLRQHLPQQGAQLGRGVGRQANTLCIKLAAPPPSVSCDVAWNASLESPSCGNAARSGWSILMPSDHTSAGSPYAAPLTTSGAMYSGDPMPTTQAAVLAPSPTLSRQNPATQHRPSFPAYQHTVCLHVAAPDELAGRLR